MDELCYSVEVNENGDNDDDYDDDCYDVMTMMRIFTIDDSEWAQQASPPLMFD